MSQNSQNKIDDNSSQKITRKFLGPSQFAAALGLSIYQSPENLKQQLEGIEDEKLMTNSNIQFGINHEAVARYCYQKQTGNTVIKANWRTHHLCRRIGGICDGMIVNPDNIYPIKGILEIKCHPLKTKPLDHIPINYLLQIAGYLALYNAPYCDFMSCCFDDKGNVTNYNIIHVTQDDVKDKWNKEWFPKLKLFTETVKWKILLV